MKKYNFTVKTALAVFAVALSACSSDNDIVDDNPASQEKPVPGNAMTFHASVEGNNATRTYFRDNSTAWAAKDKIYILNKASVSGDADCSTGGVFEIASGIGSKVADFTGGPIKANGNDKDDFYAFYPSSSFDSNSEKMIGNIPTIQYATDTTYNQALHFMTAHSTNSTFEFNNVCALLKITLTNNPATNAQNDNPVCRVKVVANPTLSSMDAQDFTYTSIAGNFEAIVNTDGIATVTPTLAKGEVEKTFVELRAVGDDGTAKTSLGNGTFYMVVLPAELEKNNVVSGFTLILEKKDGSIYQRVNTSVRAFVRNQIVNLGTYNCSGTPTGMTSLGKDVVDLDLPSGTIWATKNIKKDGSFVANDTIYGDYFSWGKTSVVASYSSPATSNLTLKTSEDAAYSSKTNNLYCMPIYAQIYEFYNHFPDANMESVQGYSETVRISFLQYETRYKNGWAKFTAPTGTGRTIYLPYGGHYFGLGIGIQALQNEHKRGAFWSRTDTGSFGLPTYTDARCLDLMESNGLPIIDNHSGWSGGHEWGDDTSSGRSIRPVAVNEQIAPLFK